MLKTLKRIWNFWHYTIKNFINDNCAYRASALAFTTILALVPLLTVIFTVLIFIPFFSSLNTQIQSFIFEHFLPRSGQIIQGYLQTFIAQTAQLSWIGGISLLVTAMLTLYTIESSVNQIWKTTKPRTWLKSFLLYSVLFILGPLIFSASFAVNLYLESLPYVSKALLISSPFIFSTAVFTLLYKIIPNCFVSWRNSFCGGLIASILFEIAKHSFAWYLIHFPTYELLYGALATIPIFLTWVYICWLIVLFGAEVSHAMRTINNKTETNQS